MSSYLRNLKISAHQTYLAFKPCIFRVQSYPTIGFYSCAENIGRPTPNQAALGLNLSINELLGGRNSQKEARPPPNANEICTRRSKSSRDTARGHVKTKSSLSIYRLPADSLFELNSIVRVEKDPIFVSYSPRFSGDISDSFLCEQIRKDDVVIFSGCSEASPHRVFCIGRGNGIPSKTAPSSQSEQTSLRFSEARKPPGPDQTSGRPSEEQLHRIHSALAENLPKFFVQSHNYRLYNKGIVFENNIRGITTRGLNAYMQQLTLVRILGHLKYAHVKMEIFKMTQHPEDGTVRVRWRVIGMPGLRILLMMFRFWEWKKLLNKQADWVDGFSILYVGADGLIYKHICDKMTPDENRDKAKVRDGNMAMKLALMVGLAPKLTGGILGGLDSAIMTMGRVS